MQCFLFCLCMFWRSSCEKWIMFSLKLLCIRFDRSCLCVGTVMIKWFRTRSYDLLCAWSHTSFQGSSQKLCSFHSCDCGRAFICTRACSHESRRFHCVPQITQTILIASLSEDFQAVCAAINCSDISVFIIFWSGALVQSA